MWLPGCLPAGIHLCRYELDHLFGEHRIDGPGRAEAADQAFECRSRAFQSGCRDFDLHGHVALNLESAFRRELARPREPFEGQRGGRGSEVAAARARSRDGRLRGGGSVGLEGPAEFCGPAFDASGRGRKRQVGALHVERRPTLKFSGAGLQETRAGPSRRAEEASDHERKAEPRNEPIHASHSYPRPVVNVTSVPPSPGAIGTRRSREPCATGTGQT